MNNTDTKIGEFQRKLNVSSRSYLTFMRQHGPHAGVQTPTYSSAHQFFQKREAKGLRMPHRSAKKDKQNEDALAQRFNVEGIHLDGEESATVPVYDTCDDIRNKITAHMRHAGNIPASVLARQISPHQGGPDAKILQGAQVTYFLRKKGPMAGNTSRVFYAAYVFFEKLRVKEGRKKTAKREEMEVQWMQEGGVDRESVSENTAAMWCMGNERPFMNRYGQIEIQVFG